VIPDEVASRADLEAPGVGDRIKTLLGSDAWVYGQARQTKPPRPQPKRYGRLSIIPQFAIARSLLGSGPEYGRVTVNVEPTPGSLSTVIVPPWATTIERAMYNPSPSPP
jgi:hypothetical protein